MSSRLLRHLLHRLAEGALFLKSKGLRPFIVKLAGRVRPKNRPMRVGSPRFKGWDSLSGPRILVVYPSVPVPDEDSGSVRMCQMLKIMVNLGCRVTLVPGDLSYRENHTEAIEDLGVEVLNAPKIRRIKTYLEDNQENYKFVFLCRASLASTWSVLVRRYNPDTTLVYDTVDLHYLRYRRQATVDGSWWIDKYAGSMKLLEMENIRNADVTVAVSESEKEVLLSEVPDANIVVIGNIHRVEAPNNDFKGRENLLFIGNYDHPPNCDAVLYFISEIFPLIRSAIKDIKIFVLGKNPTNSIVSLASESVVVLGHVKDAEYYFARCKASIAPLRFGAGVKGKINMSMSHGVPVVATSVAVEGMKLTPEYDVLIGDNPKEFADEVVRLYRSESLWSKLSGNSMKTINELYSPACADKGLQTILGAKGV